VKGNWFPVTASLTLVALIAAGVAMLRSVSADKAKAAPAVTRALPPSLEVQLSGKIRARNVVNVAPPVEGMVGAFFVDVGQEVFEGQLLARISNEGLDTGQQMAQRTLENAQERVDTIESALISARLEASRARADATRARAEYERVDKLYRRQQMLLAEGATPRLTYEKINRDFELAQTERGNLERVAAAAQERVDDLVKSLDTEKRTVADKNAELESAKARVGAAELLSPAQGIVVARNGEVGEPVARDKPDLFRIATDLSQLEVVLDSDPHSLRSIQPGQAALVSLPDQGAEGMIGTVKSIEGGQVIVAFSNPNPAVKPGMTAQVRIKVS
jgi:multidrug resistance efflux pump